jgi:hypothetical protein
MAADSSWGEVRWHEPQSNPPPHDYIMTTRTMLAGNRSLTTEAREEQHARLTEPYVRIDHAVRTPQADSYTRGPVDKLNDDRLLLESRYLPGHTQDTLYGEQKRANTIPLGDVDGVRAGLISGQIDQSRRTSELRPFSDARVSSGKLFGPLSLKTERYPQMS